MKESQFFAALWARGRSWRRLWALVMRAKDCDEEIYQLRSKKTKDNDPKE
jgi:hypothetical protein